MEKFIKLNYDKANVMWRVEYDNGECLKFEQVFINCPCSTQIDKDGTAYILVEYDTVQYPKPTILVLN
jgi:hypothetical protein